MDDIFPVKIVFPHIPSSTITLYASQNVTETGKWHDFPPHKGNSALMSCKDIRYTTYTYIHNVWKRMQIISLAFKRFL